jgi:hypothetical protein
MVKESPKSAEIKKADPISTTLLTRGAGNMAGTSSAESYFIVIEIGISKFDLDFIRNEWC